MREAKALAHVDGEGKGKGYKHEDKRLKMRSLPPSHTAFLAGQVSPGQLPPALKGDYNRKEGSPAADVVAGA